MWCGVVWCGVAWSVWCGVVWYGVLWCGVVLLGLVRGLDVVRCCMMWYDMPRSPSCVGVGSRWIPGASRRDAHARCSLPGCPDLGYYDPFTCHRERCCGSFHEQMLVRFEACPSVMPNGHFTSISVFGPDHDLPELPVKLLVSLDMTVEALTDYIFIVFFGHNPTDEDLFGEPGDVPRRWQVRLMPGVVVVPNASSTLLFPSSPGSLLCPRLPPRVVSEVGVRFGSVLRVSRLAWPSTSDLDSLGPYPPSVLDSGVISVDSFLAAVPTARVDSPSVLPESGGASVDESVETRRSSLASLADASIAFKTSADLSAVDRFSAQLQAWRRDVPLFSSLPSSTFDSAFGVSMDAIIAVQLSGVRAALAMSRAALFSEVHS